jgi:NAD+ synthase
MRPSTSEALRIDAAAVCDVVLRALRHEVRRVGFERVVLGLSGGLDSAVVAHLAVRAFGRQNVDLVSMPASTSDPASLEHAQLVAAELQVPVRLVPIGPQIDLYFANMPDASLARRGNKMARERMTVLYDLSFAERALVLGTSNKTELLLGYSTLYGDSACAIMPIGDLYKTQVFALGADLGLPKVVLEKAPSADLWAGQTDEEELGFTYADVDALLVEMVDRRQRRHALIEMGFAAEFVDRVAARIRSQQFKRKLPVIVKLSSRTIDKDFLYPRDWTG